MNVILFEDQDTTSLVPMVLGRPAYAIRCGGLRLVDIAQRLSGRVFGVVRDYLRDLQGDYLDLRTAFDPAAATLFINGRVVPDANFIEPLKKLATGQRAEKYCYGREVLAALIPGGDLTSIPEYLALEELLGGIAESHTAAPMRAFRYPHEVISEHLAIFGNNLRHRLASGAFREVAEGVFVDGDARLSPQVVCDSTGGPILLEEGVRVGPFSVLQGPLALGQGVTVTAHAVLKGAVELAPGVKAGGEIGASVMEANSNKSHYGYLGHAYVGSWVNLGAGTTNSNLKNTYGSVRVQYGESSVDTGLQFFGCVIGDYTKTAINTSIFTGKLLGVCSNVYGFVTTNVPSFSNYARSFGEVTELPPEVMEVTQRRVFERRGVRQRPADVQLIRSMYDIERGTRDLANHPPTL